MQSAAHRKVQEAASLQPDPSWGGWSQEVTWWGHQSHYRIWSQRNRLTGSWEFWARTGSYYRRAKSNLHQSILRSQRTSPVEERVITPSTLREGPLTSSKAPAASDRKHQMTSSRACHHHPLHLGKGEPPKEDAALQADTDVWEAGEQLLFFWGIRRFQSFQ